MSIAGRARAGAWTTRSCRTNSAPHSQERKPAGSVAEGPQPPPERRSGLGKAESGIAAHISGGGGGSGAHFNHDLCEGVDAKHIVAHCQIYLSSK